MCASGAKYGIMTAHFYWLGAIPAMLFVGVFMMPFYYGSRARSVPEYLKLRFDEKTRAFNAMTFAGMTVFSSGISMYALGLLFQLVLGWSFTASVLLSAADRAGVHPSRRADERHLQRSPAVLPDRSRLRSARDSGSHEGWRLGGDVVALPPVMTHSWKYMGDASQNPMGVEMFGMVAGLGFVLSFGYWCTDFLVVQRAMAAESMSAARRTPLIAAFPKMFMPFIVILPGIAAVALMNMNIGYTLPPKGAGYDYDQALTTLMAQFYPSGMLGVGLTALMASFMSGMAGNVTAFNTVWTYDIYQSYIRRNAPDSHYLTVGRVTTVVGIALSIGDGIPGAAIQQHHGSAAARIRVCERAAVRHISPRNVLASDDRPRRFLRACSAERPRPPQTHGMTVAEGKGGWLGSGHRIPVHHGAELLDRDLRLDDVFLRDHTGQSC